jgi:hypothetical protein
MDEMILATPALQKLRTEEAEREKAFAQMAMADKDFRNATDSVYGWVDDDEELDSNGDVRKIKGKSLVANGLREHTRKILAAQWHNLESVSELYEMRRDVLRTQIAGADMAASRQTTPSSSVDQKPAVPSGQSLKKRVKSET